ncbi:TonB-dependent hemoglobin/transferrin/lactoferrin family receptor [Arenicella xantha]|uniref:Hemoglobin/transferrin/lactoferrin receptor protein n=1 Tax=Arenicella xantha TaxID=644221 RepID=A0A395JJR3_9GAMM|nr:TonB-dependent hemoglobin/transferrin/lactoferrin family receptor [Arenicella xantha]RBP48914.1 hemoglobin/transferrin/lactoferrin receptor protein [Arenicella xantha]
MRKLIATTSSNVHLPNSIQLRKFTIQGILCASLVVNQANAWAESQSQEIITVTATRTERPLSEVANTVSVIDAEQIQREIANGIDDLVRYEPGVSVSGSGRFGLNSFSIRGIGGDRVLTLVDHTPTADEFSFGPFLSSRRDFVDLDALKSVEIVRGPGSSVYGSNAIGGVVNFITKDPFDYLDDQSFAGSVKLGTSSVDSSTTATALAAFGNEALSGMIIATLRDSAETSTFFSGNTTGEQRRSENPQDNENKNIYAKVVYAPNDDHSLSFTAERYEAESITDVLSDVGTVSRGVLTTAQKGVDERARERFSIDYDLTIDSTLTDSLAVLVYAQNSKATQNTLTERLSLETIEDRIRSSNYAQDNIGLRAQLSKTFDTLAASHTLAYGIDYDQSDTSTIRSGQTINRADGSLIAETSNFPTRDFPNSESTSLGIFLQDEIELLAGRIRLIPALRYDSFKLTPTADPIYLSGNTGSPTPEGYDESQVSAKFGMIYNLNDQWSLFGQYAEGFRAPPTDAVNTGFTNFAGGYTALPNPNLRPERGESVEFGLRRVSNYGNIEVAAYKNTYEDFIESLAVKGFNPQTRLLEFQARNVDEAEIIGFELKAQYQLIALSDALKGVQVRAAYAYTDGNNKENDLPLNSIDPQQLVLGLSFTPSNEKWSIETVITATDRKDASNIDASSLQAAGEPAITPFETPGFTTLDLIGHYQLNDQARINWGVFNVTDKQNYRWSEEFVQHPLSTNFDRLSEPGRNYSVTIKYMF